MTVAIPKALNLGCGKNRRADCWNVDLVAALEPDLVWDLDHTPYPLPANHFERIYAHDVVEHLGDLKAFMEEVHRLLTPGGVVEITTPHFSSANSFTDPTHRHHLGCSSFDYFTDGSAWNFYSPARFKVAERILVFQHSLTNRFVARWANRHPQRYEQRWCWLFPAWFLIFKLAAQKS